MYLKISLVLSLAALFQQTRQKIEHCKTPGIKIEEGDEEDICLECETGYFVNMTQSVEECRKCLFNCADCLYAAGNLNPYICRNCSSGFRLDPETNNCTACATGCSQCESNTTCLVCKEGYSLQGDKTCKSTSSLFKYLFIIAIVLGFAVLAWYVYRTYFQKPQNTIDHPDYEAAAYNKDLKKPDGATPLKAGKRANADSN